jgi:predicted dehydrogenase
MKQLLAGAGGPKAFVMTVNAGAIPAEHWTQDREVGGGRMVGEACHFIDLLRFLAGAPITRMAAHGHGRRPPATRCQPAAAFEDGSIGTVHYFANGSKAFPKERLEVFAGGRVLQLDNFRKLTGFGWPGFKQDEPVAAGQGPESLRRSVCARRRIRRRGADSAGRTARGGAGEH